MSTTRFFAFDLGFLPVRIHLEVENLLIASWEVGPDDVARVVPPGADPAAIGGRHLVSLVSFRVRRGRVGRLPAPHFAQLNIRTYVTWKDEPAVLFLGSRVTPAGFGGVLVGAPYRLARLRVRPGHVRAPGLGLSLRYRPGVRGDPGELGRHELGIFESGGRVRSFRVARGEADWHAAELVEPARAELLLAYGFAPAGDPDLLYSARASFEAGTPD